MMQLSDLVVKTYYARVPGSILCGEQFFRDIHQQNSNWMSFVRDVEMLDLCTSVYINWARKSLHTCGDFIAFEGCTVHTCWQKAYYSLYYLFLLYHLRLYIKLYLILSYLILPTFTLNNESLSA